MDPRKILTSMAWARVGIGACLFMAPARSGQVWLGKQAYSAATKAAVRAIGGRDLAIGVGTILAGFREEPLSRWADAGVIADASDGLATLLAYPHLPSRSRIPIVLGAAGTVAVELSVRFALAVPHPGEGGSESLAGQTQPRYAGRIGTPPR